jgi:hypothetical protein
MRRYGTLRAAMCGRDENAYYKSITTTLVCAGSYSIFLLHAQINITRSFSRRPRVVRAGSLPARPEPRARAQLEMRAFSQLRRILHPFVRLPSRQKPGIMHSMAH